MNPQPLEAGQVADVVRSAYGRDATCAFVRRGFNDHYTVDADGERFVLRVYLSGKYYLRGIDEIRFELALLSFLRAGGLPVAAAVTDRRGERLAQLPDGRVAAMFTWAPGEPMEQATEATAARLGELAARLHLRADEMPKPWSRYELDLLYLLDEPVRHMSEALRAHGRESELDRYAPLFGELRQRVTDLGKAPGSYGLIHADLHGGNIHVAPDGCITLFDFDHSAIGWRAYDLGACRLSLRGDVWTAFLDAYRSVRQPSGAEIDAIEVFARLRSIWDTGDILAMRPAWGRTDPVDEQACDRMLEMLARVAGS